MKWIAFGAVALVALGASGVAVYGLMSPATSPTVHWNATDEGVAISGYDTVAYFTVGESMKGSAEFQSSWQDATWYFSSAAHRDLFESDPEQYAPQFGGFCAAAMTYGTVVKADPEVWAIVDEMLYLNYDNYAKELFFENLAENVGKADVKWAQSLDELEQERAKTAKIEALKAQRAAAQ